MILHTKKEREGRTDVVLTDGNIICDPGPANQPNPETDKTFNDVFLQHGSKS